MSIEIIDKILKSVNSCDCKNWYERLKFLREKVLELSQSKFAKKLDLDISAISRYERGRGAKEITINMKHRLTEAFGKEVSDWVATGNIDTLKKPKRNLTPSYSNEISVSVAPANLQNQLPVEVLSVRPSAGASSHLEAIDIFDSGQRLFIDRAFLKRNPVGKLRAMQIDGYSMVPMLFPDSWVILDETKEFVGDGLYVLNFDNILMVKLLEINPQTGRLWVKSANPDYDSWEIKDEDQRAFEIFGKVVRCII